MLKVGPLTAPDVPQAVALLKFQEQPCLEVTATSSTSLAMRSLAFWQHWVPYQYHAGPSAYVAKEDGQVLGLVSLRPEGKSKACWRLDNLIIHPDHRGRGLAQELLRFVFAQFGSQGVSHFITEVSNGNDAALSLFASLGFCRSARLTYYRLSPAGRKAAPVATDEDFTIATPSQKHPLYLLHQDALPPALRLVLEQVPDDFAITEQLPFTSVESSKQRLMRKRVWYWVSEDHERRTLTSAARVTAQPEFGYRLDFAIHPGWRNVSYDVVNYALNALLDGPPQAPVWACVFDYQDEVETAIKARGFERIGEYFVLAREHWQRAKHPSKRKADATVLNNPIANPAINFPLATERSLLCCK